MTRAAIPGVSGRACEVYGRESTIDSSLSIRSSSTGRSGYEWTWADCFRLCEGIVTDIFPRGDESAIDWVFDFGTTDGAFDVTAICERP